MDDLAFARFRHEWARGDRALARELATEWIANAHPQLAAILSQYSQAGLVSLLEAYRAADRHDDATIVDMWLLAKHEPQRITGELDIHLPSPRMLITGGTRNGHRY